MYVTDVPVVDRLIGRQVPAAENALAALGTALCDAEISDGGDSLWDAYSNLSDAVMALSEARTGR